MGGLPVHFVHPFVMGSIKHARELFYSGKLIDGSEAARMGLVNRAVAHEDLMDAVWTEVEAIKKTPSVIVTIAKAMLNDAMERQGFRPRGRMGELTASLSVLSDPAHEFYERRDDEGMDAAIDWMHSAEKD
jgi:enoyl-CoA hydratase/carnithine racemase